MITRGCSKRLFSGVSPAPELVSYDVRQGPPERIDCDAYLITGSRHSVYDDLPWIEPLVAFLREVLAANRKIVGICFGHQLMAHYFGGRVAPATQGWAVGVHDSRVVARDEWMPDDCSNFALLSSHKDQVVEMPANARLYLSNDFCPISGFTMGDQVITVQGHPEFNKAYSRALMDYRQEQLGEGVHARGVASLADDTSEQEMARWIMAFLEYEDA